ncbi:MAG: hypothetical protein AAF573_05445 [Bacteroidota bacterium]
MAKEKDNTSEILKVLRVGEKVHQSAKVMAAQRGEKLQTYIENLIKADGQGLINWKKLS